VTSPGGESAIRTPIRIPVHFTVITVAAVTLWFRVLVLRAILASPTQLRHNVDHSDWSMVSREDDGGPLAAYSERSTLSVSWVTVTEIVQRSSSALCST
jgi:hypothetical protein